MFQVSHIRPLGDGVRLCLEDHEFLQERSSLTTGHDYVSLTGGGRARLSRSPAHIFQALSPVTVSLQWLSCFHNGGRALTIWEVRVPGVGSVGGHAQALQTAWGQGAKQKPEILLSALRAPSSDLPTPRGGNPEQAHWQAFNERSRN